MSKLIVVINEMIITSYTNKAISCHLIKIPKTDNSMLQVYSFIVYTIHEIYPQANQCRDKIFNFIELINYEFGHMSPQENL